MAYIKIQRGERVRECQENDFPYFEKQGYERVEKKKRAPRKPKTETVTVEVPDGDDD